MRLRARTDANQTEIVAVLRAAGATVFCIRWPFDLLVAFRGRLYLMECKLPGNYLSDTQQLDAERLDDKGVTLHIVRTLEDALDVVWER